MPAAGPAAGALLLVLVVLALVAVALLVRAAAAAAAAAPAPAVGGAAADCPVVVEEHSAGGKRLLVAREDLLTAGSKQRGALAFVETLGPGVRTLLYTAPYNGYGPVATAWAAAQKGLGAHLVLLRRRMGESAPDPAAEGAPAVRLARRLGATVELRDTWAEVVARGRELERAPGYAWLPLGLNSPAFVASLAASLARNRPAGVDPPTVWVVAGTGALAAAIAAAFPRSKVVAVPAATSAKKVAGIRATLAGARNARLLRRPVPACGAPPYPTVQGYDSLAWCAAAAYGRAGDLVWNTAGSDGG